MAFFRLILTPLALSSAGILGAETTPPRDFPVHRAPPSLFFNESSYLHVERSFLPVSDRDKPGWQSLSVFLSVYEYPQTSLPPSETSFLWKLINGPKNRRFWEEALWRSFYGKNSDLKASPLKCFFLRSCEEIPFNDKP